MVQLCCLQRRNPNARRCNLRSFVAKANAAQRKEKNKKRGFRAEKHVLRAMNFDFGDVLFILFVSFGGFKDCLNCFGELLFLFVALLLCWMDFSLLVWVLRDHV